MRVYRTQRAREIDLELAKSLMDEIEKLEQEGESEDADKLLSGSNTCGVARDILNSVDRDNLVESGAAA